MTSEAELIQALKSEECSVLQEDTVLMISTFDIERVKRIFDQHGMSFAVRNSKTCEEETARLVWSCKDIEYFGTPFFVAKRTKLECINGTKRKPADQSSVQSDLPKKRRSRLQQSKKNNCPAFMKITEIGLYPEYSAEKRFSHILERKMRLLRQDREKHGNVFMEKQYFITVSRPSEHNHSVRTSFMSQTLDPHLRSLIKTYVEDGITNISTIKDLLGTYVKQNIKGNVPSDSRSFYPSKEIIYNYVLKYSCGTASNKADEAALKNMIEHWDKSVGGNFHFRPSDNSSQTFLFCYQSQWQQVLMARYGTVVLLDSSRKMTKCHVPLYTLLVKTNYDYIIVGLFTVQWETTASIAEALNVFRAWNPDWAPKYFLMDLCEEEISAVTSVYNCAIYFDDFHRERAWTKWFKNKAHFKDTKDSSKLMSYFKRLAEAKNEQDYTTTEEEMKESPEWSRNERVRGYYESMWYPVRRQWSQCFMDGHLSLVLNANNGVASQRVALKHGYLECPSDKSLSEVLDLFIQTVFQDAIKEYHQVNSELKNEFQSDHEIPVFLREHPVVFRKHSYSRYKKSLSAYSKNMIIGDKNDKCYLVQSEDSNYLHTVDLAVPSCSCEDFYKFRFPCEHMCALFAHIPELSLESLPAEYVNSPFLTIDVNIFEEVLTEETDSRCLWIEATPDDLNHDHILVSPNSPACQTVEIIATSSEIEENGPQVKLAELREKAQNILNLTFSIPSDDQDLTSVETYLSNAEQLLKRKLEDELDIPSKKSHT